jgi:uncharacterized damage-inducible protein DinB
VIDRPEPPYAAAERPMLEGWLDYHRATLEWKCEGLPPEQLCERSVPPAILSLIGLVRHMAEVERSWFRRTLAGEDAPPIYYSNAPGGDPDGDFTLATAASVADDFEVFHREIAAARAAAATVSSLDEMRATRDGRQLSLRWIYVHMIEEYARHNGHADLIRERIDGAVGD